MPAAMSDSAPVSVRPRRRSLWDGVLPDALGLAFVALALAGFMGTYFFAEHGRRADVRAAAQAETDRAARL